MSTDDERNVNPISEMLRIIQDFSNLKVLGFTESFRSSESKNLIYDSKWCRISFTWGEWDYGSGNSISIHYGRLHAPSEDAKMMWNGEECYTWHRFEHALHFLDGRSPVDAVKMNYSTPLVSKYYEDKIIQKYHHRQPEWLMKMHMEVWGYYGERFFELFDLRRPDLWEKYRNFLKEFYDIKGRIPFIQPPMDKVC